MYKTIMIPIAKKEPRDQLQLGLQKKASTKKQKLN